MTVQLVDIGVNLTHRSFQSDREAVIRRAVAAGVVRLVNTGTTIRYSQDGLALARAHPATMTTTAGVHPHNASGPFPATAGTSRSTCPTSPGPLRSVFRSRWRTWRPQRPGRHAPSSASPCPDSKYREPETLP